MITMRCPHCDAGLRVAEKLIGQSRKCPKCGEQVQLTSNSTTKTVQSKEEDEQAKTWTNRAIVTTVKGMNRSRSAIFTGIAILVVIVGVTSSYLLRGSNDNSDATELTEVSGQSEEANNFSSFSAIPETHDKVGKNDVNTSKIDLQGAKPDEQAKSNVTKAAESPDKPINPEESDVPVAPQAVGGLNNTDTIMQLLLGQQLPTYEKRGYKDVVFGTSLDVLAKSNNVNFVAYNNPCVFWDSQLPTDANSYIFDSDKRLIMYAQKYDGDPEQYVDAIIEMFGKTNQEIQTTKAEGQNYINIQSTISYHFPNVYIKVSMTEMNSTRSGSLSRTGRTDVIVADREWLVDGLNRTIKVRRSGFEWLREVVQWAERGDISKDVLPNIPNCDLEDESVPPPEKSILYSDIRKKEINASIEKKGKKIDPTIAFVTFERNRSAITSGRYQWRIVHAFGRNEEHAIQGVYKQEDFRSQFIERQGQLNQSSETGVNAISATFLSSMLTDLNSLLAQQYFPPHDGTIEYIGPQQFSPASYQWKTQTGWTVTCSFNGVVALTLPEKAKL